MGSSPTVMTLGGVSLGSNFPSYARTFEYIRGDDQGAAIKKIKVTLSGFLEGTTNETVMSLYNTLKNIVGVNDTTFTYATGVTPTYIHNAQQVWIESYNEPGDEEFCKVAVGDYGITLYWFEDCTEGAPLTCKFGAYTFTKTPKWGRSITANRPTHRGLNGIGSTATITLEGMLFASNHSDLCDKIDALQSAFLTDSLLTYGDFSQQCRVVGTDIQAVTIKNFATYSITLKYDIGSIVEMSYKIKYSRLHRNPVITEEPFCSRRLIEFMNASAQTVTYSISISAESTAIARGLLAVEAASAILPGGIEMPGGEEEWDEDRCSVSVTITKFYDTPVLLNLFGTGD